MYMYMYIYIYIYVYMYIYIYIAPGAAPKRDAASSSTVVLRGAIANYE